MESWTPDVEPSSPMQSRKRAREDDVLDPQPTTKHIRLEPEPSPPTPLLTAASTDDPSTPQPRLSKQASTGLPQSEPGPPKRAFEDPVLDRALASKRHRQSLSNPSRSDFIDAWLQDSRELKLLQAKAEAGDIVPTIDMPSSFQIPMPNSQAADDQASQQDRETVAMSSVSSVQTERLNSSSPMFRKTLKMNGVVIDPSGGKIPQEVEELLNKYIRKERKSPPLGDDEKTKIRQEVEKVWIQGEGIVSDLFNTPLFPPDAPGITKGADILWSTEPLPRNIGYSCALPAPKTDRHFGFPPSEESDWTVEELSAADHSEVRPYSQPTRENLFPSFLVETKSEATGGTIFAGEGQAALAGAHRVCSLLWMLDQIDPSRTRSSADALVFSVVVSQRVAVANVHYYNPGDHTVYMSYIDIFPLHKDPQGCRNYHNNVADWLLEIQQPIVRDALRKLHPIVMHWKKGQSASAIADTTVSEDGGPNKRQDP